MTRTLTTGLIFMIALVVLPMPAEWVAWKKSDTYPLWLS